MIKTSDKEYKVTKLIKQGKQQLVAPFDLTGGILCHFRAFSTPEQNPALEVLSTPAHPQVT